MLENKLPNQSRENASDTDMSEITRHVFIVIGVAEGMSCVFGNFILLVTLLNPRSLRLRNVHNLLLANLALADLVAIGYWFNKTVLVLINGDSHVLKSDETNISDYVGASFLLVSILSLTSISLNRFLKVCRPQCFKNIVTLPRSLMCCVLCWIVGFSCIIAVFCALGGIDVAIFHVCSFQKECQSHVRIAVCVFLLVPLCFVGYWNFAIFRHWKSRHVELKSRYPLTNDSNGEKLPQDSNYEFSEVKGTDSVNHPVPEGRENLQSKCQVPLAEQSHNNRSPPVHISVSKQDSDAVLEEQAESIPPETLQLCSHLTPGQTDDRSLRQQAEALSEKGPARSRYSKSPQAKRANRCTAFLLNQEQPLSPHVKQLKRQAKKLRARERAFVRSLFVVFLLMIISFSPFFFITIVVTTTVVADSFCVFADLMLLLNSAVNWIVYGLMNHSFRLEYARFLVRLCGRFVGKHEPDTQNVGSVTTLSARRLESVDTQELDDDDDDDDDDGTTMTSSQDKMA